MYSLWNQQWVKAYPRDCFLKFMSAPSQKGGVVKTRRFLMLSYLTMKHAITFGSRMKRSRAELCFCVQGRGSFWGFPSLPPCSYPNIAVSLFGVGITRERERAGLPPCSAFLRQQEQSGGLPCAWGLGKNPRAAFGQPPLGGRQRHGAGVLQLRALPGGLQLRLVRAPSCFSQASSRERERERDRGAESGHHF